MYAFENTWSIVGLVGVIVLARAVAAHLQSLKAHREAVLEFVDSALIAVLLVFCILRPFVVQAFYIPSGSMEPTLQENDRILVNKFLYYFKPPQVGDIVVFDAPLAADPSLAKRKLDFIKRVVGGPGDRIKVIDRSLYRNGAPVTEPYIKDPPVYTWPEGAESGEEWVVPQGHVLVFGDNRNNSNDGHRWGTLEPNGVFHPEPFLPIPNVRGKAMLIFYPPQRVGLLH